MPLRSEQSATRESWGCQLLLGDNRAPTSVYVQVPGVGLRMKAALFAREMAESSSMRKVMQHYAHAFFNQVAQSAACNQFHSLRQRCCRWLLMTHDRMQADEFLLTQEFLAMMLGVQRTGVSSVAGTLQREGMIGTGAAMSRSSIALVSNGSRANAMVSPRESLIGCSAAGRIRGVRPAEV